MAMQRRTRKQVGKKKVLIHRVKRRTARKKKTREPVNPPNQREPLAPRRYGPY